MAHGDTGFDVTGTDGSKAEYRYGAMLRGELDGTQLETVAVNFRNPYELCVDSLGEVYCSDNDNDGNESVRICWIMDGGNYGWYGRPPFDREALDRKAPPGTPYRESWHFRGHVPGYVPATLVTGFGSPCGICINEGDGLGEAFRGMPIHADAGPRIVRAYPHEVKGYGKTAAIKDILWTDGDDYFRPDDVCIHPDGSLYVSDWYDGGVGGHAYNDPERGRIFVVRKKGASPDAATAAGPYADVDSAIKALASPNLATQHLARERLLAEGDRSVAPLKKLLGSDDRVIAARALWLLDRLGDRQSVLEQAESAQPADRALAVRILRESRKDLSGEVAADRKETSKKTIEAVIALAADSAPEVSREALLALPYIKGSEYRAKIVELLKKQIGRFTGFDRYQLETLNIAAAGHKPELFRSLTSQGLDRTELLPLLKLFDQDALTEIVVQDLADRPGDEHADVRLWTLASMESGAAARAVARVAANLDAPLLLRTMALRQLAANLPDTWESLQQNAEVLTAIRTGLADENLAQEAIQAVELASLTAFNDDLLRLAADVERDKRLRLMAFRAAVRHSADGATKLVRDFLRAGDDDLASAALDGAVQLTDPESLRIVLNDPTLYGKYAESLVERLMESTPGAVLLLRTFERRELASALSEIVLGRAAEHPDANVRALFADHIPAEKRPQRLGTAVSAADILALEGDARRGGRIFYRSSAAQCNKCHIVEGRGTAFGPELTRIGTKYERAALLETILEPSKAIAPEYVPYVLTTTRGKVHLGFLVSKSEDVVVLKNENSESITVPTAEVEDLSAREKSIMPELVLQEVTAQDAADLLAFLMTLK
jgi:putative heme-binding domain-containing protein